MADDPVFVPLGRRLMNAAGEIFECSPTLEGTREEALHARYAVMRVLRECDWSRPRIGNRIGLDHSSVIAGLKAGDRLLQKNGFYARALEQLRALAAEYAHANIDRSA
jgi:hypothetical protein